MATIYKFPEGLVGGCSQCRLTDGLHEGLREGFTGIAATIDAPTTAIKFE